MATEQQLSSVNGNQTPKRYEHILDLLDVAALGQAGFFFLDNGIDGEPLKLTYAELCEKAKASKTNKVHSSRTAVDRLLEIWCCLAQVQHCSPGPDCSHVF